MQIINGAKIGVLLRSIKFLKNPFISTVSVVKRRIYCGVDYCHDLFLHLTLSSADRNEGGILWQSEATPQKADGIA